MRNLLLAAVVLSILTVNSSVFATTIHVPDQFEDIHNAIFAAASGDTVLVQPGTYYDNIYVWPSVNGIKLISAGDYTNTIIDGDDNHRVVRIASEGLIDTTTLIEGFTIRNGRVGIQQGSSGGGISLVLSSPTIRNCKISSNVVEDNWGSGGGIWCSGSPVLENCIISGNTVGYQGSGGGMEITYNSSPVINNCTFSGNSAYGGGAIYCSGESSQIIVDCAFTGNYAELGGAIYAVNQIDVVVSNCEFKSNHAGDGGGVYFDGLNPTLERCLFYGNTAEDGGGVFSLSSVSIVRCTIVSNTASSDGGGIYFEYGSPLLSNSIVKGNAGGGIYASNTNLEISYCNFFDNGDGNFTGEDLDPDLGVLSSTNANGDSCDAYNNIFLDPVFVTYNDFHLQTDSPCIDAGDPDSPHDPDGTIADIGASYFDQNTGVTEQRPVENPASWSLYPAYPNPFNPTTTVEVMMPVPSELDVSVYNIAGQKVATLATGSHNAGSHRLTFDASGLAGGVYFVRAATDNWSDVQKVVLMK